MIAKIGIWILVKAGEAIAKKVGGSGAVVRTKVIDYLIVRAGKAKQTRTSADDDVLRFWAAFMKSDRLQAALDE